MFKLEIAFYCVSSLAFFTTNLFAQEVMHVGTVSSFEKYGFAGLMTAVTITGLIYIFKAYKKVQEDRIADKDAMIKSLNDVIEKITENNKRELDRINDLMKKEVDGRNLLLTALNNLEKSFNIPMTTLNP